jgi:Trk K+ transport system NAD-binding subunit
MAERFGNQVLGLDEDWNVVKDNQDAGRNVILGDALDSDFWEKLHPGKIKLVMLTMTNHAANRYAALRLEQSHFEGEVAAVAQFEDQAEELKAHGVKAVFNLFAEAGTGFAEHVCENGLLKDAVLMP